MQIKKDWKYYAGLALFIYCWIPYLASALILILHIPIDKSLAAIGVFVVSAEIAFALSVVLLGKPFIALIKSKVKGFILRRKELWHAAPVGRVRHAVGVVLLLVSFLPYFITEFSLLTGYPRGDAGRWTLFCLLVAGDALFMTSLFVLGGDFWDRLKALFKWRGETAPAVENSKGDDYVRNERKGDDPPGRAR